jgi:hypothetical protein
LLAAIPAKVNAGDAQVVYRDQQPAVFINFLMDNMDGAIIQSVQVIQ